MWEAVQPTGGKPPATAGHSMVFHPPSRALLVYGGHRPTTARYSWRRGLWDCDGDVCLLSKLKYTLRVHIVSCVFDAIW